MTDETMFERRLANALGRFALLAPPMDDELVAGLAEVRYGAAKGRMGLVIVTTLGTDEASGIIPLVKCATSASSARSVRGASNCVHARRGTCRDVLTMRRRLGNGASVSIGRFETTTSSSDDASSTR